MPSLSDDVLFSESAVEQMHASAEAAAPHETGGILLGMMGDDRRWVTAVREIPSADRKGDRYQVPANVTNGIVLEARALDPRIGYLGDWHSHPADSGASAIDLATYLRLLRHALSRSETTPLLVVVRRGAEGGNSTSRLPWRGASGHEPSRGRSSGNPRHRYARTLLQAMRPRVRAADLPLSADAHRGLSPAHGSLT